MKQLLIWIIALSSPLMSFAQNGDFTNLQDSDPKSNAILTKLKQEYTSYKSVEADFTLNIEIPEEDLIVQKGTISQQGDKYRLEMKDQSIISDGQTLWYHLQKNNEVQINTVDPDEEDSEMLSPQNFLHFYEQNAFICAPIMVGREIEQSVRWIELKPTDKDAEYFKLRLSLDIKKNEILRIKAFSKDGSRFTLHLDDLRPNKPYSNDHFSFNIKEHPNVRVEDLRID